MTVDDATGFAEALGLLLLPHEDTPGVVEAFGSIEAFVDSPAANPDIARWPDAGYPEPAYVYSLLDIASSPEFCKVFKQRTNEPNEAQLTLATVRAARVTTVGVRNGGHSVGIGVEALDNPDTARLTAALLSRFDETDIVVYETGRIVNHSGPPFGVQDPVRPGCSVSAKRKKTFGTIGAIVHSDLYGAAVLSNAHVLDDADNTVVQPGRGETGGGQTRRIGSRYQAVVPVIRTVNTFDAAVAPLDDGVAYDARVLVEDGAFGDWIRHVPEGTPVAKVGASSGRTTGTVSAIDVRVACWYDRNLMHFARQYEITGDDGRPFSTPGDSGSVVWTTEGRHPFALLFGGNREVSWASPIGGPIESFQVTIVDR